MKTTEKNKILFGPGGCLTREAIELYVDGRLNENEEKKINRHCRQCELCADALEGAKMFRSGSHFRNSVVRLDNSAWRRGLNTKTSNRKLFRGISSVAASIALLFGVYYIIQVKNVLEKNGGILSGSEIAVVEEAGNNIELDEAHELEKPQKEILLAEGEKGKEKDKPELDDKAVLRKEKAKKIEIIEPKIEIALEEEIEYEQEGVVLDEIALFDQEEDGAQEAIAQEAPARSMAQEKLYGAEGARMKKSPIKKRLLGTDRRSEKSAERNTYVVAEVMPMFQGGGVDNFNKYLTDSIRIILPDSVLNQSIIVGFRVDTSGRLSNVKLISGTTSREFNKQIVKIVENSPAWLPANIQGTPVAVDQQVEVVVR